MFLIFDTETTGLPKNWKAPLSDSDNWPRCVQIAWQIHNSKGECIEHQNFLINPHEFTIPYESEKIHGISTSLAQLEGESIENVLNTFISALEKCDFICGHNVKFDLNIIGAEFIRLGIKNETKNFPIIDTCSESTAQICKLSGGRGGKFKFPTLSELYFYLFEEDFQQVHNATADVEATTRCFLELLRTSQINSNSISEIVKISQEIQENFQGKVKPLGIKHKNLKKLY